MQLPLRQGPHRLRRHRARSWGDTIALERNAVFKAALRWILPRGRIGRGSFVVQLAVLLAVSYVLVPGLDASLGETAGTLGTAVFAWLATVLAGRRLHDTGRSAWWLLVFGVPVLGALWLAWVLLVQKGAEGVNRFGPDPRQRAADYLTVT